MGRHAAPAPFDEPPVATGQVATRSDRWSPDRPVTDPHLFDAPLPAAPYRAAAPAPRPPDPAVLPKTRATAVPSAGLPRVPAPAPVAPTPRSATTSLREIRTAAFAAPTPAPRMESQPAPPIGPRSAFEARTPTQAPPAAAPAPVRVAPGPLQRNRALSLSVCTVAVLGAVSAAAMLLPTERSTAQTDEKVSSDTHPLQAVPAGAASTHAARAVAASTAPADDGRHAERPGQAAHSAATPTGAASPASTRTAVRTAVPARTATGNSSVPSTAAAPADGETSSPDATTASSVPTSGASLRSIIGDSANGSLLSLNAARYELHDFDGNLMGADLQQRGLAGAGVDKTVIEMADHSSTKAGSVPTTPYTTNQLYLLSTIGGTPGLSGFTLRATAQGHLYNGLRIGKAVGARVHDVRIEAVPGSNSFPPGETFVLNDWRTDGSVYTRISVDGGGVAAAGFGTNSSRNVTVNESSFTGSAHSSGAAIWQTTNVTMNDVRIVDNRSGINFERSGGTITLNRPVFRNNRLYDMQFGTDLDGGVVTITDPVLAPGQKLRLNVPAQYHGNVNGQQRSTIHVIVNGVDRTRDLVEWL